MSRQILDHILSLVVVIAVFALILKIAERPPDATLQARESAIAPYVTLEFLDYGSPLDRALLKEALSEYYPDFPGRGDSVLAAIDAHRRELFTNPALKAGAERPGLSARKLAHLAPMYLQFVAIYILVLALSTYGARTFATYRFVRAKQRRLPALLAFLRALTPGNTGTSFPARGAQAAGALLRALVNIAAYAVLFAPAYVIAYSFKTSFEGGSPLFMILLGVVTNGLLVTYANKFYTFLMHESDKGYVQTAIVKNLNASYVWNTPDGLRRHWLFRPSAAFQGHVFHHIYANARFQYIPTVKQQASFLITGLVIIEMALNIQGHLCYELLQNILYRDYEVVAAIMTAIFLVVKATDVAVDLWFAHESKQYENARA